ncbi:MAG: hypothetical protein LLG04_11175 [Parachlamydia sp.]|nr:hypothetical protein [Parachlamydia sp.]
MKPVNSAIFVQYRAVNEAPTLPHVNQTLCRIKNCSKTAFEWIRQNPFALVSATGLTLGVVALTAGSLTLFPLASLIMCLGTLGMLKQHKHELARLKKDLENFDEELKRAKQLRVA